MPHRICMRFRPSCKQLLHLRWWSKAGPSTGHARLHECRKGRFCVPFGLGTMLQSFIRYSSNCSRQQDEGNTATISQRIPRFVYIAWDLHTTVSLIMWPGELGTDQILADCSASGCLTLYASNKWFLYHCIYRNFLGFAFETRICDTWLFKNFFTCIWILGKDVKKKEKEKFR